MFRRTFFKSVLFYTERTIVAKFMHMFCVLIISLRKYSIKRIDRISSN